MFTSQIWLYQPQPEALPSMLGFFITFSQATEWDLCIVYWCITNDSILCCQVKGF